MDSRADDPTHIKKTVIMKKISIIALAFIATAALFTSCNKDRITGVANVRIHVNDFTISQDNITKSTSVADYSGVKAITLAFFKNDGTAQYQVTQLRSDASTYTTFGDFDCTLPMGSYTMVVLGYGLSNGEPPITLTSPTLATFGDNPARETFVATQAVNITNANDAVDISATLSRVISKLKIATTDVRTENAQSVRVTFSAGGKAFNPSTGLATTNTGFTNTVTIASPVGNTAGIISYLFIATDEQNVDVTIDVLDENNVSLSHREVSNVPLKRNRMTILTGSLFSASGSGSFQVNSDWLDDYNMNF